MADETTTDAPVNEGVAAQSTSAETQPEETGTKQSAEVKQEPQATETQSSEGQNKETDEIVEWASKKGLPLSEQPTENELKLARMQREAERKMHETTSGAELNKAINEEVVSVQPEASTELEGIQQELQALRLQNAVNDFFASNPQAKEYEQDMVKLVQENPQLVAGGLDALYAKARVDRLDAGGTEEIKNSGAKEALEGLAAKQKAASPSASATQNAYSGGVTIEEVGARTRAGDLEWLREHAAEIDAL